MERINDFISFRKLIIFGSEGSGKSTLTSNLQNEVFRSEEFPDISNFNIFYFLININIFYFRNCIKKNFYYIRFNGIVL